MAETVASIWRKVADHLGNRVFRRDRDQHVDMIRHQMSLLDPAFPPTGQVVEMLLRHEDLLVGLAVPLGDPSQLLTLMLNCR